MPPTPDTPGPQLSTMFQGRRLSDKTLISSFNSYEVTGGETSESEAAEELGDAGLKRSDTALAQDIQQREVAETSSTSPTRSARRFPTARDWEPS